jgi:hypothetical protein
LFLSVFIFIFTPINISKMIIKLYKVQLFFVFLFSTLMSISQVSNGWRIGGGLGGSIYCGSQVDEKLSFKTYKTYSEVNQGINIQIYKAIDYKNEIGIRYLNTELWSFKTSDQQAINAKINEFAVIYQRSLNENSDLYSNRFSFTHNLVLGLSLISFKSKLYSINPDTKVFTVISSVGNGVEPTTLGLIKPDPQFVVGGIIGYNIGARLSNTFSLYLENTFTLSTSNDITGNLYSKSKYLNNGYTYSALTLYITPNGNKMGCPKF